MLARIETFVANVSRIRSAFLNALQDHVVYLYDGTRSVRRLYADGTGDANLSVTPLNFLAGHVRAQRGLQVEGLGGDAVAEIESLLEAPTNRKLSMVGRCNTVFVRRYRVNNGGGQNQAMAEVINAVFDGTNWSKDDTSRASWSFAVIDGDTYGIQIQYRAPGAGTWANGGWTQTYQLGQNGTSLQVANAVNIIESMSSRRLVGNSGTPSIVEGAALGTTATVSVNGTDMAGTVSATCGSSPPANGSGNTLFTVTFSSPPSSGTPIVTFTAANTAAGALYTTNSLPWQSAGSTASFTASIHGNALITTTVYQWNYEVIWR